MSDPSDALLFPSDFPPTARWKKFFIGVRWLGPDLSFFSRLKIQQASRTTEQMSAWGGGIRQEMAELISETLSRRLGWKTSVFLPQDGFTVICHGPRFDFPDDEALEEALEKLERKYTVTIPTTFWAEQEQATFGEIIDGITQLRGA
jgi:hypothetical protein